VSFDIFTIGHSNHEFIDFGELLNSASIDMVVDVRSSPFSRMYPQFNKEAFSSSLKTLQIGYLFMGDFLGGRSSDPGDFRDGHVVYQRLAEKDIFSQGIDRLLAGIKKFKIVLLCSEKEPLDCHRTLLVSRALADNGLSVGHILATGEVESHDTSLARLLKLHKLQEPDLFGNADARLSEAINLQEAKVAYSLPKTSIESEVFE
jgi:uncharacterized protein (DUF488 family)